MLRNNSKAAFIRLWLHFKALPPCQPGLKPNRPLINVKQIAKEAFYRWLSDGDERIPYFLRVFRSTDYLEPNTKPPFLNHLTNTARRLTPRKTLRLLHQ